jgi:hypothetical protein
MKPQMRGPSVDLPENAIPSAEAIVSLFGALADAVLLPENLGGCFFFGAESLISSYDSWHGRGSSGCPVSIVWLVVNLVRSPRVG